LIRGVNEFQKVTNPMSIEPIKAELAGMLAQANRKIEEAESRRANGTDQERVHAAGQFVFLKGQKEKLDVRTRNKRSKG